MTQNLKKIVSFLMRAFIIFLYILQLKWNSEKRN